MIEQTDVQNALALAKEHHQAGRLGLAEDCYREVLALNCNHADALHMLGVIAHQVGKADLAVKLIQQSLRLEPHHPIAMKNLSAALRLARRYDDAADIGRRAVELAPLDTGAFANLGNALGDLGRFEESLLAYRRALEIRPGAQEFTNLGGCLTDLGRLEEAIAALRQAVTLDPELPIAHWNLSMALLTAGDFEGWKEYEWRWKHAGFTSVRRNFQQPLWAGERLEGRRLLLHAEQGHGDAIHFIRYLRRVAERAGDGVIILECQPRLKKLFEQLQPVRSLLAAGDPLPDFDLHCPLLSLPLMLEDRPESIPRVMPYLRPDPHPVQEWSDVFRGRAKRLQVGLVWATGISCTQHHRSIGLAQLVPLSRVSGVDFHSLQLVAEGASAAAHFPNLIDTTSRQTDFAQTAACIAHLDLVISVDTAVGHLAGAMNKPVWLLLPFSADWRWLRDREDSPWYPSARLFRQRVPGDWDEPIHRVFHALQGVASRREIFAAGAP